VPSSGRQSTIDSPESVSRVKPPITIIKNTITVKDINHIITGLWKLRFRSVNCIKINIIYINSNKS